MTLALKIVEPSAGAPATAGEAAQPRPAIVVSDAGFSTAEIAQVVGVSERTIRRKAAELAANPRCGYVWETDHGAYRVGPTAPACEFDDTAPAGWTIGDVVRSRQTTPPERLFGLPVGPNLRALWGEWPESKRRRVTGYFELVERRETHAGECRAAGISARERDRRFNAEVREWAGTRGFGHVKDLARAADKARRAILRDECPDGRGRTRGGYVPPPELAEIVKALALNPNRFSIREGVQLATEQARQQGIPIKSYSAFRRWFRENWTPDVQAAICKGQRAMEMLLVPKCRRSLSAAGWLEVVELDGKTLDIQCRVPDGRGGWRRFRKVTLISTIDVGIGYVPGWDIRECESSDGVAAALYMLATEHGRPKCIRSDNGEAIKAALGERFSRECEEVAGNVSRALFALPLLGVERNGPLPYRPWAKPIIERFHSAGGVADFERWQGRCYWGGSPAARPEEADKHTRDNVLALPTLDQVRAAFATWLDEVYHEARPDFLNGMSRKEARDARRRHVEVIPKSVAALACSLPERKLRAYGRDGVTVRGWLYREPNEYKHLRLIGRKVVCRRLPWSGDSLILTDEAGVVISEPTRVALTNVTATPDELKGIARMQAKARRAVREAAEARELLYTSRGQQLAALKRAAVRSEAAAAAARAEQPQLPPPQVTIVAADLAVKAASLRRATGTDGSDARTPTTGRRNLDELRHALANVHVNEPAAPRANPADRLGELLRSDESRPDPAADARLRDELLATSDDAVRSAPRPANVADLLGQFRDDPQADEGLYGGRRWRDLSDLERHAVKGALDAERERREADEERARRERRRQRWARESDAGQGDTDA